MEIGDLGRLVAEQMEAVERDFEGREEDFEYKGSLSILVFSDKQVGDGEIAVIRQRTSMCYACTTRALSEALGQFVNGLQCAGED